jgi:hypothetical protein
MATNRQKFFKKHNIPLDESLSLKEMSKLSGFPVKALEEVRDRGFGAHRNNIESVRVKGSFKKDPSAPASSKLSAEQWAGGRLYAFLMKTPKVFYGADADIAERYGLK